MWYTPRSKPFQQQQQQQQREDQQQKRTCNGGVSASALDLLIQSWKQSRVTNGLNSHCYFQLYYLAGNEGAADRKTTRELIEFWQLSNWQATIKTI